MSLQLNGDTGVTFNDSSLQGAAASPYVLKNRIINGAMVIDQRNAGASVTPTISTATYIIDRFYCYPSQSSKLTVQQNAGSVTPPAGFTNYVGITSSSSYTPISTDAFIFAQAIEGYNVADLDFGKSTAKTVTLSFWVRSSLTGTFGGTIENPSETQCYPFSYTINAANTWEQKTITIAGSTTGTWLTTNGIGIYVIWDLGSGSNQKGTVNTWQSGGKYAPTGTTNLISTSGATLYLTGVQLEVGSTATPFERRLYGQELALCQRYFETNFSGVAIPTNSYAYYSIATVGSNTYGGGSGVNQQILGPIMYRVTKRASPTVTIYSWSSSSTERVSNGWTGADFAANSGKLNISGYDGFSFYNNSGSNITTGGYSLIFNYTASAEL